MKGRSGISRTWNLQETPWTQEIMKNMKIPRKKEKAGTTSHYINNHNITKPYMKASKQKN
jgi:hypothetical protein